MVTGRNRADEHIDVAVVVGVDPTRAYRESRAVYTGGNRAARLQFEPECG